MRKDEDRQKEDTRRQQAQEELEKEKKDAERERMRISFADVNNWEARVTAMGFAISSISPDSATKVNKCIGLFQAISFNLNNNQLGVAIAAALNMNRRISRSGHTAVKGPPKNIITVPAGMGKSWVGPAFMRLVFELSCKRLCNFIVLFHS